MKTYKLEMLKGPLGSVIDRGLISCDTISEVETELMRDCEDRIRAKVMIQVTFNVVKGQPLVIDLDYSYRMMGWDPYLDLRAELRKIEVRGAVSRFAQQRIANDELQAAARVQL